jgi:predicted lipoprotein with Yx(FWY)xxD motif
MRFRLLLPAVAIAVLVLCATAFALLKYTPTGLKTGTVKVSGKQQKIVVDTRGVTVYELGGEYASSKGLECQSRACLQVWLALKLKNANRSSFLTLGKGVPGKSGAFTRVKGGFVQATLAGHPLYYYSGDNGKAGLAKGNGIVFGTKNGKKLVWHLVNAS